MNRRNETHDDLAGWEKWPLAALFLANALNVFILYVPTDEMPDPVRWLLPWVRVACGVAAAASLEGTLIAVTMGRRLGRDSGWSWAAMFAASAFTALVAYYVHASVGLAAAGLFMAQAVVLFIYTQHLAQPRKALTPTAGTASALNLAEPISTLRLADMAAARTAPAQLPEQEDYPAPVLTDSSRLGRCKHCGEILPLSARGAHGRNFKRFGRCVKL
jgi:hypothetical protein